MSLHRINGIRKRNVLAIISFMVAALMLVVFFLPALLPALADIRVGGNFLLNYCYVAMVPLGLTGVITGILAIVQVKKNRVGGLRMSIFGVIINTIGTIYMILVVRLLIILSRSF